MSHTAAQNFSPFRRKFGKGMTLAVVLGIALVVSAFGLSNSLAEAEVQPPTPTVQVVEIGEAVTVIRVEVPVTEQAEAPVVGVEGPVLESDLCYQLEQSAEATMERSADGAVTGTPVACG